MRVVAGEDGPEGALGSFAAGANFQTSLVAEVLAGPFAAGATLAALTVALPHSSSQNDLGLLAIVAGAYAVAGVLHWRAQKLPAWTLPLALAWGSSLITGVAYFSGASPSPLVFFYLWIPLYASYFLTRREAALQVAYVGLAYAVLLALRPPASGAPAWWIVGMGTLLVAAIVITTMRVRVELLISRLYDTARTDALTSLANRRGFREMLDLELERARRGDLVIRRHPELGVQILEHPSLADVRAWVGAHHERPDGLGYPLGISGDEVPLEARIVAVADAYEAMTATAPTATRSAMQARRPSYVAAPAASSTYASSRPSSRRSSARASGLSRCLPPASTANVASHCRSCRRMRLAIGAKQRGPSGSQAFVEYVDMPLQLEKPT